MITLPYINPAKVKITKNNVAISLGLVIPFQPSMQDEKTINNILYYATELVQSKLEANYDIDAINNLVARLEKIFRELNYNTHRKSIAIIITPDEEKVFYLNFDAKPVVIFKTPFSILDLVADTVRNAEFQFLVFYKTGAELYDYFNNKLHKVFAQNQDVGLGKNINSNILLKQISNILESVNSKNDKPIFVTGNEQQVNSFYNSFRAKEILFKIIPNSNNYTPDNIQTDVKKINSEWENWKLNSLTRQIELAEKSGNLISNKDSVLKSLCKSADGLLLIDKGMMTNTFSNSKKLINQIEKFLVRGNRIEISEKGLLDKLGGIALIQSEMSNDSQQTVTWHHPRGKSNLIF